jgi:hypothetical protein
MLSGFRHVSPTPDPGGNSAVTEEGRMSWVWAIGAAWLVLGALLGVLIGRGIRLADRKQAEATARDATPNFVVDPPVLPPRTDEPIPPQPGRPTAEDMRTPGKFDRS